MGSELYLAWSEHWPEILKVEEFTHRYIEKNNNNKIIDKIVLFGSSIRDDCTENSDIDMCIFSEFTTNNNEYLYMRGKLPRVIDDICDIFRYADITDKYKKIINEHGIVVYEFRYD